MRINFRLALMLIATVFCASYASAQTLDHWSTKEQCLAATNSPNYHPTIIKQQKLRRDEAVRPNPTGACFDLQLPDRIGNRGFVRIEAGRDVVIDTKTTRILRLAECNNDVYSVTPFAPATTVTVVSAPVVVGFAQPQPVKRLDPLPPFAAAPVETPKASSAPAPVPEAPKERSKFGLSAGIGEELGSACATYTDQIPVSGDVPTCYDFRNTFVTGRLDMGHGLYVTAATTVVEDTSNITFTDLKGQPVTKRRQSDSSKDKWVRAYAGYDHSFGAIAIGGYAGWKREGLYEDYFEGVATTTVREYSGVVLGAKVSGATDSDDHKVSVSVSGEFGPWDTRKSWTQQTGFARVDHTDESGKSTNVKVEGDVQVYKALHIGVSFDHLGIDSTRPNTFTASEHVSRNASSVNVKLVWGGK